MAWWDDVGNFIGDVTGYNAQQRANKSADSAQDRLNQASNLNLKQSNDINAQKGYNIEQQKSYDVGAKQSMGANAADTMRLANEASSQQALNQANAAGGSAAGAARAAGLNAGQAAQMASQGTSGTYQNALNTGVQQYQQSADRFANQGNTKAQLANQNINQGLQQSANQASIATGNTGLANQQQATANQQGQSFLSGVTGAMGSLFSDENLKIGITDLSGSGDTTGKNYEPMRFGSGESKTPSINPSQSSGLLQSLGGSAGGAEAAGGSAAGAGASAGGAEAIMAALPQIAAAFSDKDLKEDTSPKNMESVLDSLLANVKPVKYKYKKGIEENKPEGTERVGIIAQDLEKTPLKDTVIDTPKGKQLDAGQLSANNTALIIELASQIKDLQTQLQGKNNG